MIYILIILVQLVLFAVLFAFCLYFLSMVISDFFGIPFVPTRARSLDEIFARIKIKKQDVFYDLGCGDGRLVFFVNRYFGIKAIGVELNPLLNWFSKLKAKWQKNTQVEFRKESFYDTKIADATIVYLFLFPEVVAKLSAKFLKELNKGTIIISHGFELKWLKEKQFDILAGKPFTTYYYRL